MKKANADKCHLLVNSKEIVCAEIAISKAMSNKSYHGFLMTMN